MSTLLNIPIIPAYKPDPSAVAAILAAIARIKLNRRAAAARTVA